MLDCLVDGIDVLDGIRCNEFEEGSALLAIVGAAFVPTWAVVARDVVRVDATGDTTRKGSALGSSGD